MANAEITLKSPDGPVITLSGGLAGPQGIQGIQGNTGATGATGAQGPTGLTGATGATGAAATIAVGAVNTGAPGSSVIITNSGTSGAAIFDITIPAGAMGAIGPQGPIGLTGPAGASAPDADAATKGLVQLAGDLGGQGSTAAIPILANVTKVFNARDFGTFRNDAVKVLDGVINASSTTFSSASTTFTSAIVGKAITIVGAAASGGTLRTTVASFNPAFPNQIIITTAASTSVTGAESFWGTNCTASINSAIAAALAYGPGSIVELGAGGIYIGSRITPSSYVKVRGNGMDITTLYGGSPFDYAFYYSSATDLNYFQLEDCTLDVCHMKNASGFRIDGAQNCTLSRVRIKNVSAGGWHLFFGMVNAATSNLLAANNQAIDCEFDNHAGSLESLLLFNTRNFKLIRPKFSNKIGGGPTVGLWQKTYGTLIEDATWENIQGGCLYYSYTCNDTTITRPHFNNTGSGISGGNTSDNGSFGATIIEGLKITDPVFIGGANSITATAIELGSVNNAHITNPYITGCEIGISVHARQNAEATSHLPSTNWNITNPIIFNCNPENAVWVLHPGISISDASEYGTITGGQLYDNQGTKTQRYPISIGGGWGATSYTYQHLTIKNVRLTADTANGGTSIATHDGGSVGSGCSITDNQDYSGSTILQTITSNQVNKTGDTMSGNLLMGTGGVTPYVKFGDSGYIQGNFGHLDVHQGFASKLFRWYGSDGVTHASIAVDTGIITAGGLVGPITASGTSTSLPILTVNQLSVPGSGTTYAQKWQFNGVDTMILRQGTAGGGFTDLRLLGSTGKPPIMSLIHSDGVKYADWTYDGSNMEIEVSDGDLNIRTGAVGGAASGNVNVWGLLGNAKFRVGNQNFSKAIDLYHDGTNGYIATQSTMGDIILAPAGNVQMSSKRIVSMADPTAPQDAATKAYVDAVASGVDVKASVRVATTANGTLATAYANGQVVDGVTLVTGDRILLKNQTTGSENGIYTVNASGAPTRATDADANAEVTSGLFTFVSEGTTNNGNGFVLTTADPIVLGTTALVFTQFSGAGSITAGAGLTKTGNTIDIVAASSKLTVAADSIDVVEANINRNSLGGGALTIANGGTGQTTAATGFNALSPMTTAGDIIYGGASGAGTRLAAGSATQVLIGGTTPSWGSLNVGTMVTGTLAVGNGGTGSATQNFVDISTTQAAIAGDKTWTGLAMMTPGTNGNVLTITNTAGDSTPFKIVTSATVASNQIQLFNNGGNIGDFLSIGGGGVIYNQVNATTKIRAGFSGKKWTWRENTNTHDTFAIDLDTGSLGIGYDLSTPNASIQVSGLTPASVATSGTAGLDGLNIASAPGGATSGTTGQVAGKGGNVTIKSGNGGAAPSGSTNGAGGDISIIAAGAGGGAGSGANGGQIILQTLKNRADGISILNSASTVMGNFDTSIGSMKLMVAGGGYFVKEGTNATMGTATLVGGTATISTTKITANSRVFLTTQSLGTVSVATDIAVTARTAGTSFTITSANATDTSVVAWIIIEPS